MEHSQKIVWKSPFYLWKRLFAKRDSLLLSRFFEVTLPVLTSPRSKTHVVDPKKLNRRHLKIRDIWKLFDKKIFLRKCHFTRQTEQKIRYFCPWLASSKKSVSNREPKNKNFIRVKCAWWSPECRWNPRIQDFLSCRSVRNFYPPNRLWFIANFPLQQNNKAKGVVSSVAEDVSCIGLA